jgi:hypothetical protein
MVTVNGPSVTATFFPMAPGGLSRTYVKFQATAGLPVTVRITNNTIGLVYLSLGDGSGTDATTRSSSAAFNLSATLRAAMTYTILIFTGSTTGGTAFVRVTSP